LRLGKQAGGRGGSTPRANGNAIIRGQWDRDSQQGARCWRWEYDFTVKGVSHLLETLASLIQVASSV